MCCTVRVYLSKLTQQLLRAHVTRRAGDRAARIGTRIAVVEVGPLAKFIKNFFRIGGVLPLEEGLPANQHGVIYVAAGKVEELLQIPRQQEPAPDAILRVFDVEKQLRLDRRFHFR